MQELTQEEAAKALEKALVWLKNKYPMPTATIKTEYINRPWLMRKGVTGYFKQDWLTFTITVATGRDVSRAMQVLFHEYKHVIQVVRERKFYHELKKKEEDAAWKFSVDEMNIYVKEVGTNWK